MRGHDRAAGDWLEVWSQYARSSFDNRST